MKRVDSPALEESATVRIKLSYMTLLLGPAVAAVAIAAAPAAMAETTPAQPAVVATASTATPGAWIRFQRPAGAPAALRAGVGQSGTRW